MHWLEFALASPSTPLYSTLFTRVSSLLVAASGPRAPCSSIDAARRVCVRMEQEAIVLENASGVIKAGLARARLPAVVFPAVVAPVCPPFSSLLVRTFSSDQYYSSSSTATA